MGNKIFIWRASAAENKPIAVLMDDPLPTSLDEATRRLPSGGYTTFRTFNKNKVLRLRDHFERLEVTARLAGKPLDINREWIRHDLRSLFSLHSIGDKRVRIILDLEDQPGSIYYLVEELHIPSIRDYTQGVKVITRQMHRINPVAKLTRFVEKADAIRQELPAEINEAVMVSDDGKLLEGLSSNFFAIRESTVWTANEGVLPGITRSQVIEVINELAIPLRMEPPEFQDLGKLEEAFITSASRGVLPVTSVNGKLVGSGRPGRLTRKIMGRYQQRIEEELEAV